MKIRRLYKKELKQFIDSDEFKSMPIIPITKHRALSHLSNPRASEEDLLLLIAFEGTRIVGYLGILPDLLFDGEAVHKVGWLSAYWVDPSMRRKGIARKLLGEALDGWNNHILVSDWVPNSFGIYKKSGAFIEPFNRQGVRAQLRFDLRQILPIKITRFRKIFLVAADAVLNSVNSLRLNRHKLYLRDKYPSYEKLDMIDYESVKFINQWKDFEMFRRSEKELKWILNYPWILEKSKEYRSQDRRFYFSSVCNEFRNELLKIRNNRNEMIAFMFLTVRNKCLQIPYLYYSPDQVASVVHYIYLYMYDKNIKGVTLYDKRLSIYILTNQTPFISRHQTQLSYIMTKNLAEKLAQGMGEIQDGDGERVFT